jgi:hypothetical protein
MPPNDMRPRPTGQCFVRAGSCFLHATLSMVQDRLAIHSNKQVNVLLGRQVGRRLRRLGRLRFGRFGQLAARARGDAVARRLRRLGRLGRLGWLVLGVSACLRRRTAGRLS